jgi:hypothetical protein
MEAPGVDGEKTGTSQTGQQPGFAAKAAACWKSNMSVWIGLAILVLGALGEILLYLLPGQYYIQSAAGDYFYNHYQLLNCLHVVSNTAIYVGAFWFGGYMAFWGFRKK